MIEFNKYFNDEYQFTLKNASYSWIAEHGQNTELVFHVNDTVNTAMQENHLDVTFQRKVFFTPEALFSIDISFVLTLTFRNASAMDKAKNINWDEALIENENPYLGNIISRASYLIATLTSSYGQQPLVTPPNVTRQ